MQVLRNTSTHAALLLFPDDAAVTLGPEGLAAPGLSVPDVSDQTHQLVSAPHPSPGLWWVAGALSCTDGQWSVFNESMYAKFAPQAEAAWVSALEKAKSAVAVQINAARLAANLSHFQHAGKQIACDQLSRSDIDGTNGFVALYGALPPGWPGGWKAMDNSYVAIADVAAWKAFYASMFAAGNANFAHAQALKTLLAQADTPEAVAAIQWGMELQ